MSMSKKDFIALADAITEHNRTSMGPLSGPKFSEAQLETLADFCKRTNSNFMRDRWLGYIAGENGKNGGKRPFKSHGLAMDGGTVKVQS